MAKPTRRTVIAEQLLREFSGDARAAAKFLDEVVAARRLSQKRTAVIPSTPVVVSVSDLHKSYKTGKTSVAALGGVSLDIHQGEFIALTGASGSGKSTLLQLIGGLDKPTSGKIIVDGHDISTMSDRKLSTFRNKTIGFVFQFFYLQPFLRLKTNLEVPTMFARGASSDRRARSNELAAAVGLSDRLTHYPRELSGGQMQRAAIARALMNRPTLLLADEPTGNLDSENGSAIIDLFEKVRQEFGTTIIIVTHDSQIAARADREISLKDGALV